MALVVGRPLSPDIWIRNLYHDALGEGHGSLLQQLLQSFQSGQSLNLSTFFRETLRHKQTSGAFHCCVKNQVFLAYGLQVADSRTRNSRDRVGADGNMDVNAARKTASNTTV